MSFLSRNKNKKLQHYWFMSGILELMGCSFEEKLLIWYKIYAALVIFCGTTVLVIFNLGTLYYGRNDLDAVSETMFYTVMGVSSFARGLVVVFRRKNIMKAFVTLQNSGKLIRRSTAGDREVFNAVSKITKQLIIFYAVTYSTILFNVGPAIYIRIVNADDPTKWLFSFGDITFIDLRWSPMYELFFIYQLMGTMIFGSFGLASDIWLSTIFLELKFQFTLLHKQFDKLVNQCTQEKNSVAQDLKKRWKIFKYYQQRVRTPVSNHVKLLEAAEEVESSLHLVALIAFLGTIVAQTFNVYHLSMAPIDDPRNVLGLSAMFATFSSFFMVCYCANDVILCSRDLITTCFRNELFETDVHFQKSMVLVMARAGKPIAFTAGKMVRLSMELFAQLVRLTYSCFMILHNGKQPEVAE